jgi:hypothetical protein
MKAFYFLVFMAITSACTHKATTQERLPSSVVAQKNHCEIFHKAAVNGDTCPRFGLSYQGQRIGPGAAQGCFVSYEAALDEMRSLRSCNISDSRRKCRILKRSVKSMDSRSCPNFGLTIDGHLATCYRTIEAAHNGMRDNPLCNR